MFMNEQIPPSYWAYLRVKYEQKVSSRDVCIIVLKTVFQQRELIILFLALPRYLMFENGVRAIITMNPEVIRRYSMNAVPNVRDW